MEEEIPAEPISENVFSERIHWFDFPDLWFWENVENELNITCSARRFSESRWVVNVKFLIFFCECVKIDFDVSCCCCC